MFDPLNTVFVFDIIRSDWTRWSYNSIVENRTQRV